jgi:hypothetical protein
MANDAMTNPQAPSERLCATAVLAVPEGDAHRARLTQPLHTDEPHTERGKWKLGFSLVVGSWTLALHLRVRSATTRTS